MPLVPKTYDRNLQKPKYYSTAVGSDGYNPQITYYYNNANELLRIEEVWRGKKYTQTISGSNYANHIINYNVVYGSWVETTVS